MDCHCYEITFPTDGNELDQDQEYVTLVDGDDREKVLLHDYQRFYEIPGLYEEVLYNRLKCCSPQILCDLLGNAMASSKEHDSPLRVLDFRAGNGVAGEQFKENIGCETIVGVDILEEAKGPKHSNVIPLRPRKRWPAPPGDHEPQAALVVRTDGIFFMVLLDRLAGSNARGRGHVTFADGHSIFFDTDTGEYSRIEEKCLVVARRIARIYRGTVEKGTIDRTGNFHPKETGVASARSTPTDRS